MEKNNIEKYIKDYEERKITVEEIASIENESKSTIYRRINVYYMRNKLINPLGHKKQDVKIEKYIVDYEAGNITVNDIAAKEGLSYYTINRRIAEFYEALGKERKRVFSKTKKPRT